MDPSTAVRELASEDLARFLLGRRWFGAKGRAPRSVRVHDVIPLFDGTHGIARLQVDLDDGRRALYQLPLALRAADDGAVSSVVATVGEDRRMVLFDAVEDPAFRERLGDAFVNGARFDGDGASWVIAPVAAGSVSLPAGRSRLSGAEQSNTSIVYGDRAILKMYRRLEPGDNPDVEIGEFLTTRVGFAHVPALLGTIRFHDRDGSVSVAGMLQQLVPSRGDGWSYALARFREEVGGAAPAGHRPFRDDAARLGEITRALHEALASDPSHPDFAPIPVTDDDLGRWREQVSRQVERALDLLREHLSRGALAGELRAIAESCVRRGAEALRRSERILESIRGRAGARIRHHGDFHLGQVLPTESGDFVVIDFEGEPARPLVERRQRHSALRDVAGMLRSFSYAAGAGMRELGGGAPAVRAAEWEESARAAFARGYLNEPAKLAAFLPAAADDARGLVALFELEKAFYELEYELQNRPDWVGIPLGGIERLLR
ncbi:MAG: maltokinase [Candidatus Binatota bacterium]|nr:maltokinase [Candidatus Binatota bacterium]